MIEKIIYSSSSASSKKKKQDIKKEREALSAERREAYDLMIAEQSQKK